MRFYTKQHPFYCGIDLHARTMDVCKYQTKSFLTQCRYAISSTVNRFSWRSLHDLMR
jgi:hypothetical protein